MQRWTEAELALLRDTSLSLAEVAERTGRSLHGVENKASRLGVARYEPSSVDWSDADQVRAFRRERYGKGSSGRGPYRSQVPPEEARLLRDTTLAYSEIAERTGRSVRAVEYRAKLLGVERLPDFEDWTPDELALFEDRTLQFPDIAALTGRSREAVKVKANKLGLHNRRYWHQPGYVPDGNDYRGRGWKRLRLQVLERDGFTCQDGREFVPSGEGLVVHHVVPWRLRQVNDPRFLVTLCRSHHMQRPEHAWSELPEDIAVLLAATDQRGDDTPA